MTESGLLHRNCELSEYTSLTPDAARLLVVLERFGGTFGFRDFTGIREIEYETALALSEIMGLLELSGVQHVSPDVAEGFVSGR